MQQRCFGGVLQARMILDLVNRPHAEIGTGNRFLQSGRQTGNRNKERPAVFLQDTRVRSACKVIGISTSLVWDFSRIGLALFEIEEHLSD